MGSSVAGNNPGCGSMSVGAFKGFFSLPRSLASPAAVSPHDNQKTLVSMGSSVADGDPGCGTMSVGAFEVLVSLRGADRSTAFSNDGCFPTLPPLTLAVESPS